MKAIVHSRYGMPSVLTVEEVPMPEPKSGEVLVKIHATAVNDWDWSMVRGKPYLYRLMFGLFKPRTSIMGAEVAGTVEAVGDNVTRFSAGDRVYGDISEAGFGGFAEYVCVREDALRSMSSGMSFEQAASLPHAALLAWQGLVDVGAIQSGETVLINGAGGGVGAVGLQIAKDYGCNVTGVDRASKVEALAAMGFDRTIAHERTDFTSEAHRYDLILDAKTTRSPFRYLRALKPGGRYVTVGGHLPRLLQLLFLGGLLSRATRKRLSIVALKPNQGLEKINEMFEQGKLTCVIDGPHSLADVPRAMQRFGDAEHVGKVVIKVA